MTKAISSEDKILVAVPDKLGELLKRILEHNAFPVLLVSSLNETLSALQAENFRAIIMIWTLAFFKPSPVRAVREPPLQLDWFFIFARLLL